MRRLLLIVAALLLTGCNSTAFHATGAVANDVPVLRDAFRSVPQGCTRDPFDGRPAGQSTSIAAFVWEDPGIRDSAVDNRDTAPDAPMRLEFSHLSPDPASPVEATLHTRYKAGIPLSPRVCAQFQFSSRQNPPHPPETRPSLAGEFVLDCRNHTDHITADVHFRNCDF
jgi:hypothetical protein